MAIKKSHKQSRTVAISHQKSRTVKKSRNLQTIQTLQCRFEINSMNNSNLNTTILHRLFPRNRDKSRQIKTISTNFNQIQPILTKSKRYLQILQAPKQKSNPKQLVQNLRRKLVNNSFQSHKSKKKQKQKQIPIN